MHLPSTPTMDNGRGTSVFLPDNRLRLSRLMITRDERDKIEEVVKHFTVSKLADPQTNSLLQMITTPPTARNISLRHFTYCNFRS